MCEWFAAMRLLLIYPKPLAVRKVRQRYYKNKLVCESCDNSTCVGIDVQFQHVSGVHTICPKCCYRQQTQYGTFKGKITWFAEFYKCPLSDDQQPYRFLKLLDLYNERDAQKFGVDKQPTWLTMELAYGHEVPSVYDRESVSVDMIQQLREVGRIDQLRYFHAMNTPVPDYYMTEEYYMKEEELEKNYRHLIPADSFNIIFAHASSPKLTLEVETEVAAKGEGEPEVPQQVGPKRPCYGADSFIIEKPLFFGDDDGVYIFECRPIKDRPNSLEIFPFVEEKNPNGVVEVFPNTRLKPIMTRRLISAMKVSLGLHCHGCNLNQKRVNRFMYGCSKPKSKTFVNKH